MNANDYLGGRFLRKEDFPDPKDLTISRGEEETFEGENRPKPILFFNELDKGLVCNKGHLQTLIDLCNTPDIGRWKDKKVCLYTDPNVMFAGRRVGGIRIRAVTENPF